VTPDHQAAGVTALRDHVAANLRLAATLRALPGDPLHRFVLDEFATGIVERYRPLISGGLYGPLDAGQRAALELATTELRP
jgi:hypothetical protein